MHQISSSGIRHFALPRGSNSTKILKRLELKPEYNLSKEPIRIDLLIIKEESDRRIKNEIGHIMKKNIM